MIKFTNRVAAACPTIVYMKGNLHKFYMKEVLSAAIHVHLDVDSKLG